MLPKNKVHTTPQDVKYVLFSQPEVLSDFIRQNSYWGVYNLELADIILRRTTGTRVIDVGAGLGGFTIPLAVKFQKKIVFDSFEPILPLNLQLSAAAILNSLSNVKPHRVGLDKKTHMLESHVLDLHMTNHGTYSFVQEYNDARKIPTPDQRDLYDMRKMDDYRFAGVALIKITVGGMELDVLEGAKETIEQNNLPPLIFECWSNDWFAEKKERTLAYVKELGYKHIIMRNEYVIAVNDDSLRYELDHRIERQLPGSLVVFKQYL